MDPFKKKKKRREKEMLFLYIFEPRLVVIQSEKIREVHTYAIY